MDKPIQDTLQRLIFYMAQKSDEVEEFRLKIEASENELVFEKWEDNDGKGKFIAALIGVKGSALTKGERFDFHEEPDRSKGQISRDEALLRAETYIQGAKQAMWWLKPYKPENENPTRRHGGYLSSSATTIED